MKTLIPIWAFLFLSACAGRKVQDDGSGTTTTTISHNGEPKNLIDAAVLDTLQKYYLEKYEETVDAPDEKNSDRKARLKVITTDSTIELAYFIDDSTRAPVSPGTYIPRVTTKDCYTGDLNGDSLPDMVIEVNSESGAIAYSNDVFLFLNRSGRYTLTDIKRGEDLNGCNGEIKGDNSKFYADKIEGGFLFGRSACYGPNDPNCCPSLHYVIKAAVRNDKLVVAGKEKDTSEGN